jgi:hypothetical protein
MGTLMSTRQHFYLLEKQNLKKEIAKKSFLTGMLPG